MKKTLLLLLVLFMVSGVSQVFAYDYGVSVGDKVVWDGSFVGNGGEFGFTVAESDFNNTGFTWSTFCVETTQYLASPGVKMTVTGISDTTTSNSTLTENAAWLYWNFSENTLAGYDGTSSDQNDLQQLIWLELGQINSATYNDVTQVNNWLNWASNDISSGWTNNGLVQVLNLGGKQDVLIASTSAPVPEPATMALLGIGLLGLVAVGRKKVKKN